MNRRYFLSIAPSTLTDQYSDATYTACMLLKQKHDLTTLKLMFYLPEQVKKATMEQEMNATSNSRWCVIATMI